MSGKIELSGVPETMLQTVYARAKESKTRGVISDKKAEEIIDELDYDFSNADKDSAMSNGVIARTLVLDRMVSGWLSENPNGVVVNIACGLDTRCYRLSGFSHWYNLDLPETMAVRSKILNENGIISQIAMSATDDWGSEIAKSDMPTLVVIEGLTMYLNEAEVKRMFDVIAGRFDNATVFVEIMSPVFVKNFKEKSIEASKAKFTWGIKNGAEFSKILLDFEFVEEHGLTEGMAEFIPIYKVLGKLPIVRNVSNKIVVLRRV
ncbi:MAG: class I SAM-dependent methyltransferase [Clostridia bacterium]|nr:class I SAM-dependent methyltransferase [Clostridia bacterium]